MEILKMITVNVEFCLMNYNAYKDLFTRDNFDFLNNLTEKEIGMIENFINSSYDADFNDSTLNSLLEDRDFCYTEILGYQKNQFDEFIDPALLTDLNNDSIDFDSFYDVINDDYSISHDYNIMDLFFKITNNHDYHIMHLFRSKKDRKFSDWIKLCGRYFKIDLSDYINFKFNHKYEF